MKNILGIICFTTLTLSVIAQEKSVSRPQSLNVTPAAEAQVQNPNAPDIVFTKELHDFGTINQGDNGTVEFAFKNTGKEPLVITNAQGSCGCTVPSWPKEPIKPGQSGNIKVTYDTKRVGAFTKTVTITSNAKTPSKTITIKGTVNAVAEEETFPAKKTSPGSPLENKN